VGKDKSQKMYVFSNEGVALQGFYYLLDQEE